MCFKLVHALCENPEVVRSTELVLLEKMNGACIVQGCNGESQATRGQQVIRRDA